MDGAHTMTAHFEQSFLTVQAVEWTSEESLVVDVDIDSSYTGSTEFAVNLAQDTYVVSVPLLAWSETWQSYVSVGGVYFDGQPLYGSGITEFELALEDNQSHTLTIYYVAGK